VRFASLGSGSRGNATLIEAGGTCLLVDCGFSVAETRRRLARLGKEPEGLAAILVTHEHTDHARGVESLARKFDIPVWATAGTAAAWTGAASLDIRFFSAHQPFAVGDLEVLPFPVPHDAREPAQFAFSDGASRLGLLTDTGSSTPHIQRMLDRCDALLLECNHDPDMLAAGHYPPSLKARILGDLGHLSNLQAAELLRELDRSRLQHLVAAHLSEKNNTPHLAVAALASGIDCASDWIAVADQSSGLSWRSLQTWC
jgi:phosphoribosyl 1,2-cyclic phosphodiesterase